MAHRLRSRLLRVRTQVLNEPHPGVAIIDTARRIHADMIAMQTHGRSGLARLLMGSVADKVLHGATVPLLLQRPTVK